MATPEPSYPTTASPGYFSIVEAQENDFKSNLVKVIDAFKEEMNKSFKEIQENTIKQAEAFKEETNKSLKETQKNTIKQVKVITKML